VSVNSLANFGTPGLNGDRSAQLQPILTYKYRAQFYDFGGSSQAAPYALTRQLKKVTLPNVEFPEIKLASYVSVVYVPGRGQWKSMSMTFADDITNSIRRLIENQIAKQQNFFDQTVSRAGENFKFEMDIDILAGGATAGSSASDPNVLRRYSYAGCWIMDMNDGELNVDEESQAKNIDITVRFDNCIVFDQSGAMMATMTQTSEIAARQGVASTGIGAVAGTGINITGASVTSDTSSVAVSGGLTG